MLKEHTHSLRIRQQEHSQKCELAAIDYFTIQGAILLVYKLHMVHLERSLNQVKESSTGTGNDDEPKP